MDLPTAEEINARLAEEPSMEGAIEDTMEGEGMNAAMEEMSSTEETLMDKKDADDPPHIP
jgi:hypothetical protein